MLVNSAWLSNEFVLSYSIAAELDPAKKQVDAYTVKHGVLIHLL